MNHEFSIYKESRITMAKGISPPNDMVVVGAMASAESYDVAMALSIVQGEPAPEALSPVETSDVSLLTAILPFLRENGIKDIHKLLNMPMFMLERWHSIFRIRNEVTRQDEFDISKEDFEDMMNG